ncbi:MAG: glycosyltransferase [Saprospiraceae bacterium]|jgi:cellulose synthase/poly-beta-1,6-N-acetylglucosamine synthase-like glycosyltransferase
MDFLFQIFFWASTAGIAHSYLFYPLLLKLLAKKHHSGSDEGAVPDRQPRVTILMAAHNEARVLAKKLDSIALSGYPMDYVEVYLGSDGSTDDTNAIANAYASKYPWLQFFPAQQRNGKPELINRLARAAIEKKGREPDHIFIITDANVLFTPSTLPHLLRHFTNPAIAVVDSRIIPEGLQQEGISRAEHRYISLEGLLKYQEGLIWGAMIGPFGGCYAIRAASFSPVPPNFLVDDFYIVLKALEKGGKAISDPGALCIEGATHAIGTEFRRKRRIGAGNFQNMRTFRHLWFPPWKSGLHFAFFSHKVLRWLGPHLLLLALFSTLILSLGGNRLYGVLLLFAAMVIVVAPVLDWMFRHLGIQLLPLRGIRYFLWMNAALFMGWIQFLKGIKTNVWQPTQRN